MKSDFEETPFDTQMQDDLESRRAQPTHVPIRIGPTTPDAAPAAAPDAPTPPVAPDSTQKAAKERVPTPVVVGLAMALGAICVVGASLGMKHAIKPLDRVYPTLTALPPTGNEVMQAPDTVIKNPDTSAPEPATTPDSADANAVPEATPSVEISELPAAPKPQGNAATTPPATTLPGTDPPADTHHGAGFEITPPPGFSLRQSGRRTIWQRDDGAQILVETGKAGDGSPHAGWQKLDRDLARRYGARYRSLGIRGGTLASQPAAIWEFELTDKNGVTRHKTDIGITVNGRGYAVLGSAPKDKFGQISGELQQALASFRVKTTNEAQPQPSEGASPDTGDTEAATPRPTRQPRVPPTPAPTAPELSSPVPLPEKAREAEKGY